MSPPADADAAGLRALAEELASAARRLAGKGLCEATSGNFSARVPAGALAQRSAMGRALVSRSGVDKLLASAADFVVVDERGAAVEASARASAETLLHLAVYAQRRAGAVVHTHGVASVVLSRARAATGAVVLHGWEMQKALEGVASHEATETIPILANTQDMSALAAVVAQRLAEQPGAHAFLIAGHGLTTWGTTVGDAVRHAEALEYLFECVHRFEGPRP